MARQGLTSHVVLTCVCPESCPIPGHGTVPPDPVDPRDLVAAGEEALRHLDDAVQAIVAARAAWVSRGLDSDNPFPRSLDVLAGSMSSEWKRLREWTAAAAVVAERRTGA